MQAASVVVADAAAVAESSWVIYLFSLFSFSFFVLFFLLANNNGKGENEWIDCDGQVEKRFSVSKLLDGMQRSFRR